MLSQRTPTPEAGHRQVTSERIPLAGVNERSPRVSRRVVGACLVSLALTGCASTSGRAQSANSTSTVGSIIASTASAGATTISQSSTSTTAVPTKRILELAQSEGTLTTLLRLLKTAGLGAELSGGGPFSLLAPSDAAFAKLDPATLDKLERQPDLLRDVLRYHVVAKKISAKDVSAGKVSTLEGSTVTLKAAGAFPTVNGANVTRGAKATNGTILVIDTVLIPPDRTLP